MSQLKQLIAYVTLIVLTAVLWIVLSVSGLFEGLEQETLRWRYLVRGEVPPESPVVFVNVDYKTMAIMGDKPWDRLNFAQTIHALLGPGRASAVGVDIVFSPIGASSLLDLERARNGNYQFGEVVNYFSDRLVLAAAYTGTTQEVPELPLKRNGYIEPSQVPFPEAPTFPIIKHGSGQLGLVNVDEELSKGEVPYKLPAIVDIEGEVYSHQMINEQLIYARDKLNDPEIITENGVHRIVDADGFTLDSIPVVCTHRLLTLGLQVFLAANGLSASDVEWEEDSLVIWKDGAIYREIPLLNDQILEVNWLQGWDFNRKGNHYSMADVLEKANALGAAAVEGNVAEVAELEEWFQRFQDKVIFIGATDFMLKDLSPTPFNRDPVPKVGVHANVFRTVDEEAYIREVDEITAHLITVFMIVLVVGGLAWSGRLSSYTRTLSVAVMLGYVGLGFAAFSYYGVLLPLVAPSSAAFTAALFVVFLKLGSEEQQRRRIKNLFGAYVSPSLVNEMVESKRDPELGGTQVQVTALFSDVEGFSAVSEELSPNELVALMNEYLGAMTEVFQKEHGTLDKYIGDAIVTMFGMPYPVEDHALRACRSAIHMQERHAELREQWAKEKKWPDKVINMRTRIGINTGEAVIGNMGSEMRFTYTMMGDSVNLAARCESGAKSYGVYTMITGETLEAALKWGTDLNYRKLDRIVVKGRNQPVDIYELWDRTVDKDLTRLCRNAYEAAFDEYTQGKWESARAAFLACMEYEPARDYAPTTPSEVLASRCRRYMKHVEPESWDGVYRMTSK